MTNSSRHHARVRRAIDKVKEGDDLSIYEAFSLTIHMTDWLRNDNSTRIAENQDWDAYRIAILKAIGETQ